ncbi:MAG: SH3 domain-containing protein [Marinagarivorans sp.]|nr:SH3 domain-containing protein [Marinagarivorans sp.]
MSFRLTSFGTGLLVLLMCFGINAKAEPLPAHWQNSEQILTVTAPYIDLRLFAGRGYPIFHIIEKGEKLYLLKRHNEWFKVETTNGKVGWVNRREMNNTKNEQDIALDFSNNGWRDKHKNRFEIGLTAGSLEGAIAFSPFITYHLTANISTELAYTQAYGNFSTLKIGAISLTHQPFPKWRVSPYFRLGSGIIQTQPNTILVQSEDREDPILTVGGGIMLNVSHRLMLRMEYDSHTIMTTRDVNEEVSEWKAGFGVLF